MFNSQKKLLPIFSAVVGLSLWLSPNLQAQKLTLEPQQDFIPKGRECIVEFNVGDGLNLSEVYLESNAPVRVVGPEQLAVYLPTYFSEDYVKLSLRGKKEVRDFRFRALQVKAQSFVFVEENGNLANLTQGISKKDTRFRLEGFAGKEGNHLWVSQVTLHLAEGNKNLATAVYDFTEDSDGWLDMSSFFEKHAPRAGQRIVVQINQYGESDGTGAFQINDYSYHPVSIPVLD